MRHFGGKVPQDILDYDAQHNAAVRTAIPQHLPLPGAILTAAQWDAMRDRFHAKDFRRQPVWSK